MQADRLLKSLSSTGKIVRAAMEKDSSAKRSVARAVMAMDAGKWDESKHPRRKDGKFGKGGSSASSSSSSEAQEKAKPAPAIATSKVNPRKPEPGASVAQIVRAGRITAYGEESKKHKAAEADSGQRFYGKSDFPAGSAFGREPMQGAPTKTLPKGTGATRLTSSDLSDPDFCHSVCQYLDDEGRLTPEREKLHSQAVDNIFVGKHPKPEGEKKVFTMFGGGAAAGKGALSDPDRCAQFGTPSKEQVATIDPDELKKDIPEYRDMQASGDIDNAAAFAHEESSVMAKRAMEAAILNGYDYTLDGTGDGSVSSVMKKIKMARDAGYEVNACYVTCPTELAVERSLRRAERTQRKVPLERVRSIHRAVSQIFPQVASEFDHVTLWDTNQPDKRPKMIAECRRGEKIKVYDQKLYDEFLAKAEK